jgi:hypothetical protein
MINCGLSNVQNIAIKSNSITMYGGEMVVTFSTEIHCHHDNTKMKLTLFTGL